MCRFVVLLWGVPALISEEESVLKRLGRLVWLCLVVTLLIAVVGCSGFSHIRVLELDSDLLTVTFIDVGQGDSILIRTPSRENDAGGRR